MNVLFVRLTSLILMGPFPFPTFSDLSLTLSPTPTGERRLG